MKLYNNVDNNINYEIIDLKLRKINDDIYDSIIKKVDGYYCRIVCGYKPYDQNHTYGENNVIHNGLYMIYPLPQNEIQEYKLENFNPPKLLDGNSLITVDSFNSTNPSEFTIKVPIDRRYMASREYIEGKNILLEAREDRNHNKAIQIKEIYNDTNKILGEEQINLLIQKNLFELGEYTYKDTGYWFNTIDENISYRNKITNNFDKIIYIDIRSKETKKWIIQKEIGIGKVLDISSFEHDQELMGFAFWKKNSWLEETLPNKKQLSSLLEPNTFLNKKIILPRALQPNEIYSWDEYRKHYVIKKNITDEKYQNYSYFSSLQPGYRYIREWMNGNSVNTSSHWVEIEVWSNGTNICIPNKTQLSSSTGNNTDINKLIDGDKNASNYYGLGVGNNWVQIDLLQIYSIDEIKIWHFFSDGRTYKDIRLECSRDGIVWDVIYNNESPYKETSSGKTHTLQIKQNTVINNEALLFPNTNKILISKQLINDYQITFKNEEDSEISTIPITMNKVEGIEKTAYFNIVDKPEGANKVVFNIDIDEYNTDSPILNENFNFVTEFSGRINDSGILVADETTKSYYLHLNTSDSIDLFVKGGDILKIGCIQNAKNEAEDGDTVIGVKNYSKYVTEKGVYLHVDLKDIYPTRDVNRILIINTNSIGTVESNPCTELFIMPNIINYYENIVYDEIEYFEDKNEIIEVNYEKIKDYEEPYSDTLIINDWLINESGEIEKKEDGKAYSAIVICNPKDSFRVTGEIDTCSYLFLDENKKPISIINNKLTKELETTTTNAPEGTQYCLFYLNTQGLLKEEDINLTIQSFSKSSEIDNYIKIEGEPTISISAPYKKIRPLDKPTNIKAVDQKTSLVITWDEILGAEEYIVYLEDQVLEVVRTNRLELFREIRGNISIRAINDLVQSPLSDREFIHSVPRNPFIIYIDNRYENNQYTFDVTFKDNSELETSYKLKYVIDDREEETVELPGYEGTGTLVKGSFSSVAVDQKVKARVLAVNEQGENEVAPFIEMRMPPDVTWAYNDDSKQLAISWLNTFPESELYLIRYKLENAEHFSTQTILNEYTENSRITAYLPLEKGKKMTISLAATVREDLPHIFSKPIECSSDKDVNLVAPTEFKSRKITNDQVEFTWIDNHEVEDGWELAITLNNKNSQTVFIPSTSNQSIGSRQTYVYTFPEHGFMDAKLRMKWMLGTSSYTDTITNYYFEVDNRPPMNMSRMYTSSNSIKFTWEAQSYVKQYMVNIKKVTEEEYTTYYCSAPEFYFDDFEEVDYIYNITTEFLGEIISEPSVDYTFKPTKADNVDLQIVTNEDIVNKEFIEKTYTEIADSYELATKSIKQGTEIDYPIFMNSTTQFTIINGPIAIETWGVGQRFVGNNVMSVSTKNVELNNTLYTVSYQPITDNYDFKTTIITNDSSSYKIEMEVNQTRIICFGDSITAGHPGYWAESGTGDIEHSYPYWLDRRLKFKYEVINKGYGSDRTTELINRIDKDVIALNPQYCLIQIGTNDLYWGAASANGSMEAMEDVLDKMKTNIKFLVKKCMDNNIKPILGLLIPRTQVVTDELVKYGLYSFNDWIVEYANTTEGLNYVDFFNAGKDAIPPTPLEDPNSPGAMNPIYDGDNIYDEMGNLVQYGAGIHLNKEGYKIMAEAIPLNLFNDFSTGLKMYMDKDCTTEAEYNIDDKQNPYYKITVEAMQLTRTKKIIRYIKNVGIGQTLFALYPTKIHNLKFSFKTDEMETADETAYGILTAGKSIPVVIELTPQTEDSKSEFELSLVGREFSINS